MEYSKRDQVKAIDSMLLNAYGTCYKFEAKCTLYDEVNYEFPPEGELPVKELLLAKNVLMNLWSVLDYCCVALYCEFCDIRAPKVARQIKFPYGKDNLNTWAKKNLKLDDKNLSKFVKALEAVQLKSPSEQDAETPGTLHLPRLHFLRNALTHRKINIIAMGEPNTVSPSIAVPKKPWSDESIDDTDSILLKDLLLDSCKIVEHTRDELLKAIDVQRFREKISIGFTKDLDELEVKFTRSDGIPEETLKLKTKHLHLECYGIDVDCDFERKNRQN